MPLWMTATKDTAVRRLLVSGKKTNGDSVLFWVCYDELVDRRDDLPGLVMEVRIGRVKGRVLRMGAYRFLTDFHSKEIPPDLVPMPQLCEAVNDRIEEGAVRKRWLQNPQVSAFDDACS